MKGDNMKNKNKRNKMDPVGNFVRYGSSSAKWTALFAFLAIFSVLTLSVAQVSFAIGTDYPDQLTKSTMDTSDQFQDPSKQYAIPNGGISLKYAYANDVKVPVYCLEIWANFPTASYPTTFNKTSEQTYMTPGVAALLTYANSQDGPFGKDLSTDVEGTKKEQAAVQLALWLYLYKTNVNGYQDKVKAVHNANSDASHFYMDETSEAKIYSYPIYGTKIKQLVEFAEKNAKYYENPSVSASTDTPNWSVDGDYLVSDEITFNISPLETLESFKINVNDVPEGTVIVFGGEEYNKDQLGDNKVFGEADAGKALKVKVPRSQVTNTKGNINLSIITSHKNYNGWEYKSDNDRHQRIAAGKPEIKEAAHSINLTVQEKVPAPATGQNSSMTLYITGLIVLLCGIGIVCANVNPSKQK